MCYVVVKNKFNFLIYCFGSWVFLFLFLVCLFVSSCLFLREVFFILSSSNLWVEKGCCLHSEWAESSDS